MPNLSEWKTPATVIGIGGLIVSIIAFIVPPATPIEPVGPDTTVIIDPPTPKPDPILIERINELKGEIEDLKTEIDGYRSTWYESVGNARVLTNLQMSNPDKDYTAQIDAEVEKAKQYEILVNDKEKEKSAKEDKLDELIKSIQ